VGVKGYGFGCGFGYVFRCKFGYVFGCGFGCERVWIWVQKGVNLDMYLGVDLGVKGCEFGYVFGCGFGCERV